MTHTDRSVPETKGVDVASASVRPEPSQSHTAFPKANGMRIFFDTEFIENGETIDLLSIGVVREDGWTYYAEPLECDRSKASDWVKANVLPSLFEDESRRTPRLRIAQDIIEFVGEKPEFWAYYADYDWVALCQLYGTMMELPQSWPMFCLDLKQMAHSLGNPKLPEQTSGEHNALADAKWNASVFQFLGTLADATKNDLELAEARGKLEAVRVAVGGFAEPTGGDLAAAVDLISMRCATAERSRNEALEALRVERERVGVLSDGLRQIQLTQQTGHGCMATILENISNIARSVLAQGGRG